MASNIDVTLPVHGVPTTQSVRDNFAVAKAEIEALQGGLKRFMTVEDFGAVGDGTADDSDAFDAYAAHVRTQITAGQTPNAWVLGFGRVYYVTRSINCTGFTHTRFEGNHSRIASADLTHPVMDFLNSSYCTVSNLRINAGQQAAPALVGISYGMARPSPGASNMTFKNVEIDGYFTRACMQNCQSEVNMLLNAILTNHYTSGTVGSSYCFIADGMTFWGLNSRYVTDTRPMGFNGSYVGLEVLGCSFQHGGDGSAIWDGGGSSCHHYVGGYMSTNQGGGTAAPVVKLVGTGLSTDPLPGNLFRDFVWDVHTEFNPICTFLISSSSADFTITGLKVREPNVMLDPAGSLFKADTGIAQVFLHDADLMVSHFWRAGSKMFDQPAKYTLTGKVMIDHASVAAGAWNAPYSGTVEFITDTNRASVTLGVYGSVADASGTDLRPADVAAYSMSIASGELYLRADNGIGMRWNGSTNAWEFEAGGTPYFGFTSSGGFTIYGTQVVKSRITGWGAATGGSKAAFNAGTATLPQTAAALAQLIADMITHGLIGS